MATKTKKRASFATRLLDLIMPPKKKKKSQKRRADPHARAIARRGLARLKAQHKLQEGQRASDVLSAVGEPLAALETALSVIDRLRTMIAEAEELLAAAREGDIATRALLAERYDEVRLDIGQVVHETKAAGFILLARGGPGIRFKVGTANAKKSVAIRSVNLESGPEGIDLPPPESGFADNEELDLIEHRLIAASERVTRAAEVFVADAALLSSAVLGTESNSNDKRASGSTR